MRNGSVYFTNQHRVKRLKSLEVAKENVKTTTRISTKAQENSNLLQLGPDSVESTEHDSSCLSICDEDYDRELLLSEEDKDDDLCGTDSKTTLRSSILPKDMEEEVIREYGRMRATGDMPADLQNRLRKSNSLSSCSSNSNCSRSNGGTSSKFKSSIYVDAFNLALETVLEDERHLFDVKEIQIFAYWKELNYEAQFLYVRLFLRKSSTWHRVNALKYHKDISDIPTAVEALQNRQNLPEKENKDIKTTEVDEQTEWSATFCLPIETEDELGSSFTLADSSSEMITTLEEASSLLSLEELKIISKEAKVNGKNKAELVKSLCQMSKNQSGLGWLNTERCCNNIKQGDHSHTEKYSSSASNCSAVNDTNCNQHFLFKIMAIIGPCIRLSLPALKLFERVHLVFYRSTEWTEKSLINMILVQISQRNFPQFIVSRSANIFASRSVLLEYEAALCMQFRVDRLLESSSRSGPNQRKVFEEILTVFDQVYPRWEILMRHEKEKWAPLSNSHHLPSENYGEDLLYLCRFSPAWVYTRIVHKGAHILGRLKQYEREYHVISKLLDQRFFHPARRGIWYQRKALLEERYMFQIKPAAHILDLETQKKYWRRIALRTSETGLQDKDCHQVYHYDLQKRICKLEKQIKIPKREKHDFGHVQLCRPTEVWVEGIQVIKSSRSYGTHHSVRTIDVSSPRHCDSEERSRNRSTKTIWIDETNGCDECSVEAMCLSSYRSRGYKGYHAEGGIVHTLFAYLFYDILFMYVPNVFQSAYQTCPLDLHTDYFFPRRISEINQRLVQIENGDAASIIETVNNRERDQRTCIIGLNWDIDFDELLEVVACFNPHGLAVICRVLAQEYRIRRSGMPDLFLWHVEKGEVVFVEVKSSHDRLSETQRLWIHVLTDAGLRVELCHAVAKEIRKVDAE
ncbi:Fanconi-associated nuclease 1-like protein [Golovinomyces cichoracearum]|uniref:Fanconi-associated nuclease n=1 Tax=Golovinomyces cichoracearum TaxID=62708 RepID=A0A420H892_9PEZI|nr:Fanconi-associated nuclease 1-like protein [Golovinomyces cichoracearum]